MRKFLPSARTVKGRTAESRTGFLNSSAFIARIIADGCGNSTEMWRGFKREVAPRLNYCGDKRKNKAPAAGVMVRKLFVPSLETPALAVQLAAVKSGLCRKVQPFEG